MKQASANVTQEELARKLGFSKSLVSRALAGRPGVNAASRAKILEMAASLNYPVYKTPTPVRKGEPLTIGILMADTRWHEDLGFWFPIFHGIESEAKAKGWKLLVSSANPHESTLPAVIEERAVSGVILCGVYPPAFVHAVQAAGAVVVLIDHHDYRISADCILTNNIHGAQRMTHYLGGLGHERIAFVGDCAYADSFAERQQGYELGMADLGMEARALLLPVRFGQNPLEELEETDILRRALDGADPPTALICGNDILAINVMRLLNEWGIQVPRDISLTGFDDIQLCSVVPLKLTTMRIEKHAMGARAVQLLARRIYENPPAMEEVSLGVSLVIRDSTAPRISGSITEVTDKL